MRTSIANNDMKDDHIKRLQQHQEKSLQQAEKGKTSTLGHEPHSSKHFTTPSPEPIRNSRVGIDRQLGEPDQGLQPHEQSPRLLPAIVEDSQDRDHKRSMTPIDIEEDSQLITEDDLVDLFPVTPVAGVQNTKASSGFTCNQKGGEAAPLEGQCKTPRQTLAEAISKVVSTSKRNAMASTKPSTPGITTPIISPLKGGQAKRPQQELADKPRGILRGSSAVAKRGASMANIDDSKSIAPHKRRKTSTVGPVIEDSQSQTRLPSVRSRMSSTKITRKTTRGENRSRRSQQY